MKRQVALFGLFLLLPSLAHAGTTGFAKEPVWVSRSPITQGETVLIHAAFANGTAQTLTGNVVFRDNGTALGTLPIELKADEARVISLSWTPKEGKHELAVELANASETSATRTEVLNVTVRSKETAAAADGTANLSLNTSALLSSSPSFSDSSAIQNTIAKASPAVADFTSPAFAAIDSWRQTGSTFLTTQTEDAKGKVAGISAQKQLLQTVDTDESKKESRTLTMWQILRTILLYVYETLNLVISKAGVFYPVLALSFLFFLFKIYQRIRRPSYDY